VFSLSKPTKMLAGGKYRLEIYVGDDLVTTATFTIKGGKSNKKSGDE